MPITILMPALSPTMTEGNLVKWHKKEGDVVKAGQVIAEIETDKATMEVEAVDEGILGRIIVPEGSESVAVNSLIALLLEEGEDASVLDKAPSPAKEAKAKKTPEVAVASSSSPSSKASSQPAANDTHRVFASPLARRMAEQTGVDLKTLSGSGPHGRIIKFDVENATQKAPSSGSSMGGENVAAYTDIPLTMMRKVIAKRLTESKQQVPHFYLTVDCTLDDLLTLRADLNARLENEKLSVNDFIIRATALALTKVPEANVAWAETALRQYHTVDIAIAVAVESGLMTPIIRECQNKSLRQLSQEMKSLVEKARAGKLTPEEFQGGTFTISNLGMYGIKHFGAIINPPQACILAVGAGEQRPIIRDGQIQIATQMTCTLSVDHRAVDGAVGSTFLAAFKSFIEDPLQLVI